MEHDFSEVAEDLRKLPAEVLKVAKTTWYKVGAGLLARTKSNTPVGVYSNEVDFFTRDGEHVHFFTKKVPLGGQLRLRWQQTPVVVVGSVLKTIVYNNTEYAIYVELGHRIRNKKGETIGYVTGRYMMTNSLVITREEDIPRAVEEIVRKVKAYYESR